MIKSNRATLTAIQSLHTLGESIAKKGSQCELFFGKLYYYTNKLRKS